MTARTTHIFGMPASTLALMLLFLAAVDGVATLMVLDRSMGRELNPFMQWLWSHGPAVFILTKLGLTAFCVHWIERRAGHPVGHAHARFAALVGLAIYVPIVGLHIFNNFAVQILI